jgi:pentatricopeptide repeat protein
MIGEKIEVISLNVIIAGCLASDEYDRAFATFAAIQQFGASPNTESYNLLLQVHHIYYQ